MCLRVTKASWAPSKREKIFAFMDSRVRLKKFNVVSINEVEIDKVQSINVALYNSKEDADNTSTEASKIVNKDFAEYFTAPPEIF